MKRALGIYILAGIILLLALATGFSLLHRLFYVFLLALSGSYLWGWLNLRWLEVQVEHQNLRIHAGEPIVERITVRNRWRLPIPWLEVKELTDLLEHNTGMTFSLSGQAFRSWRTTTLCRRRGVYTLGPIRVVTGDPFGLFRFERRYGDIRQLIVLPAVVPLPHFEVAAADLPGGGPVRWHSQEITPHASMVRDYAPGDSVKRMHWPSSAKLGRLMVKEFDLGMTSDLWILLDLERDAQTLQADEGTDELAVTVAASVASRFLKTHRPVGLAVSGDRWDILPPSKGSLHSTSLMEMLAQARAEGTTPLAGAISHLDRWLSRYTSLVVVTPSSDSAWLDSLRTLAARNVRLSVVLVDGSSFGGAHTPAELLPTLTNTGALSYLLRKEDDLGRALTTSLYTPWTSPVIMMGKSSR